MRKDDVAEGEQTQIGARVDRGVYTAFRQWVKDENGGRAYSNVGSALERAMLEYMSDDNIEDTVTEIDAQTRKNEALLRQVLSRIDGDEAQKVKGQIKNTDEVPQGKNPGDRRRRELHVIRALYESDGAESWQAETIKEAIREVAGVSSPQTVDDYLASIVDTRAFMTSRKPNRWLMDRDAVVDMLAEDGLEVRS
jgi:hypothetical protein